jgi:hypothetical protein
LQETVGEYASFNDLRSSNDRYQRGTLVAPDVYVLAVQDYLKDVGAPDEFGGSDLPDDTCRRHDAVEAWCDARQIRKPSKIAVANKVIGLASQVMLLDPARADKLRRLHSRVAALFVP